MEKLDIPRTKNYAPLIVWADDLFDLIAELQNCEDIKIIADNIKFESIEEFIQERRGIQPSVVQIKVGNPYINIELYPRWARVYVSSSQLIESGLFLKIDTIFSRCERKPRWFFSFLWPFVSSLTIPNLFYLAPLKSYSSIQIFIQLLMTLWMISIAYIHIRKYSSIYPERKINKPNFFRRNTDNIVIAIISALLGAIGGAAATKISDRIWPNNQTDASQQNSTHSQP